ncbi:hypothetical protein [Actinomycetospora termitidis]|uniref:DUF393 domain-containing protein n=1 Tax=Actinomycetospora termitidis TaxID=3053470 RepID=A0ABT7M862_9PSEU|nr:hypothetical protein [Actinomycetospora sp. Odt1-22]MDL5156863.1 hypothetical protein [Actinomycetospora sp. Odt1-22]
MPDELVLAFDADCATCRTVAAEARRRVPEMDVLPLRDYRVRAWREEAYGAEPPHAPTLLAVSVGADGTDHVRAWHGPAVALGLVRTLGPRRAAALVGLATTIIRVELRSAASP